MEDAHLVRPGFDHDEGALLVGVSAAKAMALVWDVPFVAVNHLEAHLYASFLEEPDLELPAVVLLVSGGHTMLVLMEDHLRYRVLGSTLDDAAASLTSAKIDLARLLKGEVDIDGFLGLDGVDVAGEAGSAESSVRTLLGNLYRFSGQFGIVEP